MMMINLAACGGGNDEISPPVAIAEAGPGTYDGGPLGDPHRLCGTVLVATGKTQMAAEVRGLEGDAFWLLRVNGGLPDTGRVMPDGAGGATAQWEAELAPGDRVELELYALAPKRGTATWQSAAVRAW